MARRDSAESARDEIALSLIKSITAPSYRYNTCAKEVLEEVERVLALWRKSKPLDLPKKIRRILEL